MPASTISGQLSSQTVASVVPDLAFLDGLAAESLAEDKIKDYAAKAQAYAADVSSSIRQVSLAAQQQATAQ